MNGLGSTRTRSLRRWVDTTYVDDELRVGRGDKGSIFVAARKC